MMGNRSIYALVALALLISACGKAVPESVPSDDMTFYVSEKNYDLPATKAILEDTDRMFSLELPLYVNDLAGINRGDNNPIRQLRVDYNRTSRLWRSARQWTDTEYEFYAYVMSDGTGSNSSVELWSGYAGNPGHSVNLYQPDVYVHDDAAWSDYLLSYRVSVHGSQKPLVRFDLERITSGVELYVSTPEGAEAMVESITFTDITRSARYTIAEHAVASSTASGIRNKWVYQSLSPTNPVVDYTRADASGIDVMEKADEDSRYDSRFLMMRFVTVPQEVDGNLVIDYRINETGTSDKNRWTRYSATFDLGGTSVTRWELGRKARYYISLDTAIELEGIIDEWIDIDYVEGTFLPK